jgi:hypothetical protein
MADTTQDHLAGADAKAGAFTPGPWIVHHHSQKDWAYVVPAIHASRPIGGSSDDQEDRDNYAQQICSIRDDDHGRGDALANARLIAAAPDLLEALMEVKQLLDIALLVGAVPSPAANGPAAKAIAAIRKATGVSQ